MKVLIVSGFLGAGKTTFIQHLIAKAKDHYFAVFENEFGQTDIDAKLIGQNKDMKVWEMTENCVCCTGKTDFITSLFTISSAVDPEILIVEPTGVARLGNLITNITSLHYGKIQKLQPIAIVDAGNFFHEKESYDEIYFDQIRHAATIILSKSEQMTEEELAPCREAMRALNPAAEIVTGDYAQKADSWWEDLLYRLFGEDSPTSGEEVAHADHDHDHDHDHHHHDHDHVPMETVTLNAVQLSHPVQLIEFLELAVRGAFGRILRAKGYLPCGSKTENAEEEWLRFDLVNGSWLLTGFLPQEEAKVTLIGPKVREERLHQFFNHPEL